MINNLHKTYLRMRILNYDPQINRYGENKPKMTRVSAAPKGKNNRKGGEPFMFCVILVFSRKFLKLKIKFIITQISCQHLSIMFELIAERGPNALMFSYFQQRNIEKLFN